MTDEQHQFGEVNLLELCEMLNVTLEAGHEKATLRGNVDDLRELANQLPLFIEPQEHKPA